MAQRARGGRQWRSGPGEALGGSGAAGPWKREPGQRQQRYKLRRECPLTPCRSVRHPMAHPYTGIEMWAYGDDCRDVAADIPCFLVKKCRISGFGVISYGISHGTSRSISPYADIPGIFYGISHGTSLFFFGQEMSNFGFFTSLLISYGMSLFFWDVPIGHPNLIFFGGYPTGYPIGYPNSNSNVCSMQILMTTM